ncbi:DUF6326 family protein [Propionibacteriaceae bacterium G1746]
MNTPPTATTAAAAADTIAPPHQTIPLQAKLAAAWASFMFFYIYVDILALYKPGVVDDILSGIVWQFDITQTWAITALALLAVPILMVWLSLTLPVRANRIANLVIGSIQVPFAAFNAVGELGQPWMYFYLLGVALELMLLAFILRSAWAWPRQSGPRLAR